MVEEIKVAGLYRKVWQRLCGAAASEEALASWAISGPTRIPAPSGRLRAKTA